MSRSVRAAIEQTKAKARPISSRIPPPILPRAIETITSTKTAKSNGSEIRKKSV